MKFGKATKTDIPFIVQLIANDKLGQFRERFEDPLPNEYYLAFNNINQDSNQELIVVETDNEEIIGTMQLSFIQ